MKTAILTLLVSIFFTLHSSLSFAQQKTLAQCMEYALENSLTIQQNLYSLDNARLDHNAAVAAFFPSMSASTGASLSFGRAIDPADNSYTTITTFSNSYNAGISLPIFSARRLVNNLKQAKLSYESRLGDMQTAKDNICREVMSAYFDVVYYEGIVELAKQRLEVSRKNLELVKSYYELGQRSRAQLSEVEASVSNDEYTLIAQENSLHLAYISLRSAMNYPQEEPLQIVTDIAIDGVGYANSLESVKEYALANHNSILSAERNVKSSQISYSNAKWSLWPSLSGSISYNYGTSYYTRMGKLAPTTDNWAAQMKQNRGSSISLGSLSIPIFSGFNRRHNKLRAHNNLLNAQLSEQRTRRSLDDEITRAYQQMQGYGAQFVVNHKRVETAQLAYDGMEQKFQCGMISAIELQTSANSLLQAQADMLRTRLYYIIQCRVVDYYNGVPFIESAQRK